MGGFPPIEFTNTGEFIPNKEMMLSMVGF